MSLEPQKAKVKIYTYQKVDKVDMRERERYIYILIFLGNRVSFLHVPYIIQARISRL